MKIAVCIKRVPSSDARIKIDGAGTGIDPADIEYGISPYDEMALERAVQLGIDHEDLWAKGSDNLSTGNDVCNLFNGERRTVLSALGMVEHETVDNVGRRHDENVNRIDIHLLRFNNLSRRWDQRLDGSGRRGHLAR